MNSLFISSAQFSRQLSTAGSLLLNLRRHTRDFWRRSMSNTVAQRLADSLAWGRPIKAVSRLANKKVGSAHFPSRRYEDEALRSTNEANNY
jgi:hypothetical protein